MQANQKETEIEIETDCRKQKIRDYLRVFRLFLFILCISWSVSWINDPEVYRYIESSSHKNQTSTVSGLDASQVNPWSLIFRSRNAKSSESQPAVDAPQEMTVLRKLGTSAGIVKFDGYEVLKCVGLVLLVVGLVAISSHPMTGMLHSHATEPFLSRQNQVLGLGFMLGSGAVFWRGHTTPGWCVLGVGFAILVVGIFSEIHHTRRISTENAADPEVL